MSRILYCLTRDADHSPLLFSTEAEAQEFLDADLTEDPEQDNPLGGPYSVVIPPELDARELATVLAALRCWQSMRDDDFDPSESIADFHDIADEGGKLTPLSVQEIDSLCERLNVAVK